MFIECSLVELFYIMVISFSWKCLFDHFVLSFWPILFRYMSFSFGLVVNHILYLVEYIPFTFDFMSLFSSVSFIPVVKLLDFKLLDFTPRRTWHYPFGDLTTTFILNHIGGYLWQPVLDDLHFYGKWINGL